MQSLAGILLAVAIFWGGGAYVLHVTRNLNAALPAAAQAKTAKVRTTVRAIRAQARADDWLERRRAKRAAREKDPPVPLRARAASATRSAWRRAVVPGGGPPVHRAARATVTPLPAAVNASPQPAPPRRLQSVPPPERTPAPMTTPASGNGSTAPSGASADLFTAVQQITGRARAGGIRSKQRAIVTLSESFDYMAQVIGQWSQQLAEPDQNYPAAIWEPLAQAAAHLKAAANSSSESASSISAMLR